MCDTTLDGRELSLRCSEIQGVIRVLYKKNALHMYERRAWLRKEKDLGGKDNIAVS